MGKNSKKKGIPNLPTEPGKRLYRFIVEENGKDVDKMIKEEDLTTEDMAQLAAELISHFVYLPDPAQDIVLAWIDARINHAKIAVATGQMIHDMDQQAGLHNGPNVSAGGIILPGNFK